MKTITKILILLHKKKILLFLPVILIFIEFYSFITREVTIFPGPKNRYITYADSSVSVGNNGNSIVTQCVVGSSRVVFTYTLRTKYQYPYAGFIIKFINDSDLFNLNPYDDVLLTLDPCNSNAMRIMIRLFAEGFTDLEKELTYRYYCKEVDLIPGVSKYKINLREFQTPQWWYEVNQTTESALGKTDLGKMIDVKLESAELSPIDTEQTFILYSLSFKKDNSSIYLLSLLILVLYFVIYWIILFISTQTAKPVVIPYEKLNVENYADEETRKTVQAIARMYTVQELTITKICRETGVSTTKIAAILQQQFNCTFKQYLNSIRLSEARRLIKKTDRQVSEIAYIVGYKSVTHFHRVFKQVYNTSPNEYRKS